MDPETITEIISAIASAVQNWLDSNATGAWQTQVSGKLDLIIKQNSQILQTLQNLPLLIDEDLEKWFDGEAANAATSLCKDMDSYMAGKTPDRAEIRTLRPTAEQLLTNLEQRGPCVYPSTAAIAWLVIGIHKLLRVGDNIAIAETEKFVNQAIAALTEWAGTDAGMFGKAIIDTQAVLAQQTSTLASEPRGHVAIYTQRVEYEPIRPGPNPMPSIRGDKNGLVLRPEMFVALSVYADVSIDDQNLTYSLQNPQSGYGPDGLHFESGVVNQAATQCAQRIQSELNAVRDTRARLAILQNNETALRSMIATLTNWNPTHNLDEEIEQRRWFSPNLVGLAMRDSKL